MSKTSKYINEASIYITTKLIYILVIKINISRVGGIMFLLDIFKYFALLFSYLGKLYSFYSHILLINLLILLENK